jgi:hypothetical protein
MFELISNCNANSLCITVIHPYYKLHWIELHWGGAEAQEAEIAAGNYDAKNWVDEAERIVEAKVRYHFFPHSGIYRH